MSISNSNLANQKVTILMGVRDGAAHLPDQLDSISTQTHKVWRLLCSDDGSTDDTREIIQNFATDHPDQVDLTNGPQNGFSANFMKLIAQLPEDAGYVGFADQDDIWEPNKIARGLEHLHNTDAIPTLYSVRVWYWYPATERRVASHQPTRPPGFCNALVENIATGNTILLNPAAARLARAAAQRTEAVFAHDWWLYLLVTGAGGQVIFDPGAPAVHYRQHETNVIGAGQSANAQIGRKIRVLQGAFADRIQSNLSALHEVRDLLTPDHRAVLDSFAQAREASLLRRLKSLQEIGPYRQTLMGNIGFWGAASLGRI